MRYVEASVSGVVLVSLGIAVAVDVVTVEVARHGHLAISAYAEAVALGVLVHAV